MEIVAATATRRDVFASMLAGLEALAALDITTLSTCPEVPESAADARGATKRRSGRTNGGGSAA